MYTNIITTQKNIMLIRNRLITNFQISSLNNTWCKRLDCEAIIKLKTDNRHYTNYIHYY